MRHLASTAAALYYAPMLCPEQTVANLIGDTAAAHSTSSGLVDGQGQSSGRCLPGRQHYTCVLSVGDAPTSSKGQAGAAPSAGKEKSNH